jgi:nicotinate-nucleotide adenylyltransferase
MGGTFDPIHLAHLIIAEEARCSLALDRVIFIPAGQPWMKSDHDVSPAEHRLAMVRLAIASNPGFTVSTIELERPGPSYTVDTLEILWKELGYDCSMYLLLGWDSLADLDKWKAPYRISKMATLAAFPRPGYEKPDIKKLEAAVPGLSQRIMLLDSPHLEISSTRIRQKARSGQSIRYLAPDDVASYINRHGLYKPPAN